ncbi:MAG TPA: hypothetical protein VFA11_06800 [Acidimicrobiales bacterium]|nr:hypothetical protein [Acidimicrobiales bacterium]
MSLSTTDTLRPEAACPVATRPVAARRRPDVYRTFSVSMVLSGLRCVLSYVILPLVTPVIGAAAGVGAAVGIPVGVVAIAFDVLGIRRFWRARHRLRWPMTVVYLAVIGMVGWLVAGDVSHLLG